MQCGYGYEATKWCVRAKQLAAWGRTQSQREHYVDEKDVQSLSTLKSWWRSHKQFFWLLASFKVTSYFIEGWPATIMSIYTFFSELRTMKATHGGFVEPLAISGSPETLVIPGVLPPFQLSQSTRFGRVLKGLPTCQWHATRPGCVRKCNP